MVIMVIYRYLIFFNLDRPVFSSLDDPADQIMVMVVITEKADGGGGSDDETMAISHSLTIARSLLSQIVLIIPKIKMISTIKLFMLTLTSGWCKACVRFQLEKQPL